MKRRTQCSEWIVFLQILILAQVLQIIVYPFSIKNIGKYLTKEKNKNMEKTPWKCDLNQERDILF